jgi:acyl-CoA synthetase (AMP-forming)/AMP-acid ligase II
MRPAIHFGGECFEGDAFFDRYRRSAAALRSLGVGAGEVVAILLRNEPALLELMLAARWVGARWCMINWHFKADEVRHILADSGARVLVVHADLLAAIRAGIPDGVRVFGVEPPNSAYRKLVTDQAPEGEFGTRIEGVGKRQASSSFDPAAVDDVVQVKDEDALAWCHRLAREEGILAGGSSGCVAAGIASLLPRLKGLRVATVFPDSGAYYLSKYF